MTDAPRVQIKFTEIETTRRCGDCSLCCKLLPVRSLGKGAGEKCKHQSFSKGCAVYAKLMRVSPECRFWSCRWLVNDGCEDLKRPDRSGYVLDMMPEFVTVDDPVHGRIDIECAQIWIDPSRPDAHRDPALRAWLEKRNLIGLVRFPDHSSIALIPPARMDNRKWFEKRTNLVSTEPHSFEEVINAIGAGH